jgi:hypothetical protein
MTPARTRAILFVGLAIGLALRLRLAVGFRGTFDMLDYLRWGTGSLDNGLSHAYIGIYFPLQYQIFEACVWLARQFGAAPATMVKCANLLFDAGTCALLIALLRRWRVSVLYALMYWLHPWFLIVFALGYVDFQFAFFVLLSIWLLQRGETASAYLLAGAPFAAVALMKPQAILLAAAIVCYAGFWWKRTGRIDVACMLVPTAMLGAVYELYFAMSLWPSLGPRALAVLPVSYIRTGSVMPVMTAHMLNVWYPIAYALKAPGAEIWTVSSKLDLLPHVQVRFAALLLVIVVIAWYGFVVAASTRPLNAGERLRYLLTFTALIVPAIMTSAHENHLFMATVLLVPVLASDVARGAHWAIHLLLVIQAVNLEGVYGVDRFALWLRPIYSFGARATLAVVAVVCFAFTVRALYAAVRPGGSPGLQAVV